MQTIYIDTEANARAYMVDIATSKGVRLMSGVGNDMSTAMYTHRSLYAFNFWPNGIDGGLIRIHYNAPAPTVGRANW